MALQKDSAKNIVVISSEPTALVFITSAEAITLLSA